MAFSLGLDIIKCRGSDVVKGPVLEASDSISLLEGSGSDPSSPLRTDNFSADVFFGTTCLICLSS